MVNLRLITHSFLVMLAIIVILFIPFVLVMLTSILSFIFLIIIISYIVLLLLPEKKFDQKIKFTSITILIPAHNEAQFIKQSIHSAKSAIFNGKKEIIVIDDGSFDDTATIAKKEGIKVFSISHKGKSYALNLGISKSQGELIAIMDGDSEINKNALIFCQQILSDKKIGAVSATIRVKNNSGIIGRFLHIEQLHNSLIRYLFSKVNANIVTPGPLSVYKKSALIEAGKFKSEGFSEDVDIAIRLNRSGYGTFISKKAIAYTNMPISLKGFFKQRMRFARGWINILKRHLGKSNSIMDLYSIPMGIFWYLQAVIMGVVLSFQIIVGYINGFILKGEIIGVNSGIYFLRWMSIIGMILWIMDIINGKAPLDFYSLIVILASLISYTLLAFAIIKLDSKIDFWNLLAFCFMFPFWLINMFVYMAVIGELFEKKQLNKWDK